jgi:hypothetical protein
MNTEAKRRAKAKYYNKIKNNNPERIRKYILNRSIYKCICCDFETSIKTHLCRHISSRLHNKRFELFINKDECFTIIKPIQS